MCTITNYYLYKYLKSIPQILHLKYLIKNIFFLQSFVTGKYLKKIEDHVEGFDYEQVFLNSKGFA